MTTFAALTAIAAWLGFAMSAAVLYLIYVMLVGRRFL
jgi:hypothetical protein